MVKNAVKYTISDRKGDYPNQVFRGKDVFSVVKGGMH